MLTTNKLKQRTNAPPKKLEVVITSGDGFAHVKEGDSESEKKTTRIKPKEFNPFPDVIQGVNKRETKKVAGGLLTTADYKDRVEASKPKPVRKKRRRTKKK